MADHLEDDEQVEALKRWWDENGRSTIVAVVLAVGGTLGWQQYQGWTAAQTERASDLWEASQIQLQSENADDRAAGAELAETLKSEHAGSAYARYAALQLASNAVQADDLDTAEAELRWALSHGDEDSELGQLIQLRLARVLAARGSEDAALAILDAGSTAQTAGFAMARGDIHFAAGRHQEALEAYLEARDALLALGNPPGLLETKIASLEARLGSDEASS